MRTFKYYDAKVGTFSVSRNLDWTGDVKIAWVDEDRKKQEFWMPARILLLVGHDIASQKLKRKMRDVLDRVFGT